MNKLSLTYLPKKYKAVPFTHHERMIGGRITNIDTFYACCSEKNRTDAEWIITKSIQPLDETSYGFAIVGLSELLKRPVIVKICKKTDVKDYCTEFAMKIEEVTKLDTIIQMMVIFLEDLESINNAS